MKAQRSKSIFDISLDTIAPRDGIYLTTALSEIIILPLQRSL